VLVIEINSYEFIPFYKSLIPDFTATMNNQIVSS